MSSPTSPSQRESAPDKGKAPKVGVIYNPRSHRNKGQDLISDPAPHVIISQPGDQSQLPVALQRFADRGIDLLVINGGDGTVRDVLTAGCEVFGDDWPIVAVLPKGKTNALAVDLQAPKDWSLQGAIDAYRFGKRVKRRALAVRNLNDGPAGKPLYGFILGAGVFTLSIRAGQDAHRLGAFNALAVGVTTLWTVLQVMLGSRSNRWRRGSKMALRLGKDRRPLPHSGLGDPEWRQLLFASTMENFPAGMRPFGALEGGLKMAILDQPSRTSLLRLPQIFRGRSVADWADKGFHQVSADRVEVDFGDEFILDGEAYPAGSYEVSQGPMLEFVRPA